MQFQLFSEVKLNQDLPQYNLVKGIRGIIVDYCPRETGENGYILEILDDQDNGFDVIAVEASKIEPLNNNMNHQQNSTKNRFSSISS